MQNLPGKFIVLEGADGSGKTTQFKLLAERLKAVGHDVEVFDFPRYEEPSSYFVKKYLNGDYGPASQISPYTASLFYALDRYEAANDIRKALASGKIVLSNRYVGSNMAHQGSKIADPIEQRSFFVWADSLEYQLLGIPRPSLNIFLRVPAEVSYELISHKAARSYTKDTHDEHEKDVSHLRRSVATYDTLCKLFPKDFLAIECTEQGRLLSVAQINDLIWAYLKPALPANPAHPGHGVTVKLEDSRPVKTGSISAKPAIDIEPHDLRGFSLMALSQLSIHGVEMRPSKYWSSKSGYEFYKPGGLKDIQLKKYQASLDKMAELHKTLHKKLTAYVSGKDKATERQAQMVLRSATPMAALAQARLKVTDSFDPESLAKALENTDIEEFKKFFQAVHKLFGKSLPKIAASAPSSNRNPQAIKEVINQIGQTNITQVIGDDQMPFQLVEARPHNEFDLLPDILYLHTSMPLEQIAGQLGQWSYDHKLQAFTAALSQNSDALASATYKFDALISRLELQELLDAKIVRNLRLQAPTVRYGYDVPDILEEAGAEDEFLDCFDESLSLYSMLQAADRENLAAYATLQGHKLRCQFSVSAQDLFRYKTSGELTVQGAIKGLIDKIGQAHPLIYEQLTKQPTSPKSVRRSTGRRRSQKRKNSPRTS